MYIHIDTSGIERALANVENSDEVIALFKERAKRIIFRKMFAIIPRGETRMLASSVRAEDVPGGFIVGPTAAHALFVDQGTGMFNKTNPHLIFPKKRGGVLRWFSHGHPVFAKYTRGQPGQEFIKQTREETRPEIFALASKLWREHHIV